MSGTGSTLYVVDLITQLCLRFCAYYTYSVLFLFHSCHIIIFTIIIIIIIITIMASIAILTSIIIILQIGSVGFLPDIFAQTDVIGIKLVTIF